MNYLLDSNIFIEPKKHFYEFDICPDFWTWIRTCKDLASIEEVREEIFQGNDELVSWIKKSLRKDWFLKCDIAIQKNYSIIVDYVNKLDGYSLKKKDDFIRGADGWLIAAAMQRKDIIVTQEKSHISPTDKNKIYLPAIAKHFNVECIMLCDLLRRLKIKLKFDPPIRFQQEQTDELPLFTNGNL